MLRNTITQYYSECEDDLDPAEPGDTIGVCPDPAAEPVHGPGPAAGQVPDTPGGPPGHLQLQLGAGGAERQQARHQGGYKVER